MRALGVLVIIPPTEQKAVHRRFTPCIQIHRASLERHERRASWCERWRSIAPIAPAALQAIAVLLCLPGGMRMRVEGAIQSISLMQRRNMFARLKEAASAKVRPSVRLGACFQSKLFPSRQRSSRLRRIGTSIPLRRQWTRQVANSHRSWTKRCIPVHIQTPCPPACGHTRACPCIGLHDANAISAFAAGTAQARKRRARASAQGSTAAAVAWLALRRRSVC